MRSAELIGLTPNGKFVVVVTESGEELAIAADDRLRAALRGDRPRLGQLEIEMETALTPREIQARIRAGEDVADVARVSGLTLDRVERFAAPVLAERDHVARQALSSTVRRRGETSANRNLRAAVNERLQSRGIETTQIAWDAYRQADGRWIVTASYSSGGADRQAQFAFDPPGRFSVGGNDEAHWILGDSSASKGPQPGRRRPVPGEAGELGDDTEPTLDLSDELALVRVVQDAIEDESDDEDSTGPAHPPTRDRTRHWTGSADPRRTEDTVPVPELRVVEGGWEPPIVVNYPVEPGPPEDASDDPGRYDEPTDLDDRRDEEDEFEDEQVRSSTGPVAASAASDAVDAVDPSDPVTEVGQPAGESEQSAEDPVGRVPEPAAESSDDPKEPAAGQAPADSESDAGSEVASTPPPPEPAKPTRRKRASVPSWDEIMFGGPGS